MTYSKQASGSIDEVELRLREAAARHKFGILNVHDLKKILDSKGIALGAECRVYDVCNPQAASEALHADLRISAILPCRISIFSHEVGCMIATVEPSSLFQATGLSGAEALAREVDVTLKAIIDECA